MRGTSRREFDVRDRVGVGISYRAETSFGANFAKLFCLALGPVGTLCVSRAPLASLFLPGLPGHPPRSPSRVDRGDGDAMWQTTLF